MAIERKPIFDAVRAQLGRGFTAPEVALLDKALDDLGFPKTPSTTAPAPAPASTLDPDWIVEGRKLIGTREIVGPKHNSWIVAQWAKLGASWFNDDETPWCGLFVAHCMQVAGIAYPGGGSFARALAWKTWGKVCPTLQLGAVCIFERTGGGHVGMLVGQNAENLYVLGGNQSNMVSIMPIAKARLAALRWPIERALGVTPAPPMTGGVVSSNEA